MEAGLARHVLCYRTVTEASVQGSGRREGIGAGAPKMGGSLQWSIPIFRVTPWIKFDVRNLFNKDTLIVYNTTVVGDPNSPVDSLGYPTGFTKAATFGRPTSTLNYVIPRQYLVYAGVRF